jgi:hypothetical protein
VKKRPLEKIYSRSALSRNHRCKKVAFSPSFSCSAGLALPSSSRRPPMEMSQLQIFARRRCRAPLAQTALQICSWSQWEPTTVNKPLQESSISARVGPLELLWCPATGGARSAALTGPPPSREAWRCLGATPKLLQRANRPQLLPTRCLPPSSNLRCSHLCAASLDRRTLRSFPCLCHSPCLQSPCLLCPSCPILFLQEN